MTRDRSKKESKVAAIWKATDFSTEVYKPDVEHYYFAWQVAARLNQEMQPIWKADRATAMGYIDWQMGGHRYDEFEALVKEYLGAEIFQRYDDCERVDAKLLWELKLMEKVCNGIDVSGVRPHVMGEYAFRNA